MIGAVNQDHWMKFLARLVLPVVIKADIGDSEESQEVTQTDKDFIKTEHVTDFGTMIQSRSVKGCRYKIWFLLTFYGIPLSCRFPLL